MGKWTYLALNAVFFAPLLAYLWLRHWRLIFREKKFIGAGTLFGLIVFFVVDPIATGSGAWGFDYRQTLGVRFGNSVLEELIWAIILCFIVAVAVSIGARREEKQNHIPHK